MFFIIHILSAITLAAIITSCTPASGSFGKNTGTDNTTNQKTKLSSPELLDVIVPDSYPSQIKDYTGFKVSFNKNNATPNWVSWELLASETDGISPRSNKFWQDDGIDGCPHPSDYKHSGFDKGHMSPSAENKWSRNAMYDCFVMTNMCPQDHALNSGAWSTLEKKERIWAQRDSLLIIVAGPIYTNSDIKTIGYGKVRIPSAFFKVILAPDIPQPRAIGFIYPNFRAPGNMQNYSMTVDKVEEITGYNFFHALPDEIEDMVESKTSFAEWNRN